MEKFSVDLDDFCWTFEYKVDLTRYIILVSEYTYQNLLHLLPVHPAYLFRLFVIANACFSLSVVEIECVIIVEVALKILEINRCYFFFHVKK